MNQIIYPEKIEDNLIVYKNLIKSKKKTYRNLFVFSTIVLLLFIFYYLLLYLRILKKAAISNNILEIYDIQKLYSSTTPVSLPGIILDNGDTADILGVIEIDKINLRYPILSKTTNDFLKIAPCKFYGPELNSYGNFCIAGHNYDNNELFSALKLLEFGDTITTYNLDRKLYLL